MKLSAIFPMDRPDGEQDEYEATGTLGYEKAEREWPGSGGPMIEDLRVWRVEWDSEAKRYVRVEEMTGDADLDTVAEEHLLDAWRADL